MCIHDLTCHGDTGKTAQVIKGLTAPSGVVIAHQSKVWMDGPLMQRWVKEIWHKYTEKKKSLLVFDTFKARITEEVRLHFLSMYYCLIEYIDL